MNGFTRWQDRCDGRVRCNRLISRAIASAVESVLAGESVRAWRVVLHSGAKEFIQRRRLNVSVDSARDHEEA